MLSKQVSRLFNRTVRTQFVRFHHIEAGVSSGTPLAANVADMKESLSRLLTSERYHSVQEKVCILGVPVDENSSYVSGAALAPPRIREAFHCTSANYYSEHPILNLATEPRIVDAGDLITCADKVWDAKQSADEISTVVSSIVQHECMPFVLGGDHSISYPVVRGVVNADADRKPLTILHLDAHSDMYDDLDGNPYSHGSPFARIMEEGLCKRLVQVGVRCSTTHLKEQSERFGVEVIEMKDYYSLLKGPQQQLDLEFDGPLWVSVDLDVMDPAFVPGVSHHEPGGLSTRDVVDIIQSFKSSGEIVGMDLVELNPTRDLNGVTAMVAAKLMKEMVVRLLTQ